MEKNNNDLPDGFEYIEPPPRIIIHFNPNYKRLYLSEYIFSEGLARKGSSIGLAYNKQKEELLIDKQGNGFKITADGYILAKQLYEFLLRRSKRLNKDMLYFEFDYNQQDTSRFLVFKMIERGLNFK